MSDIIDYWFRHNRGLINGIRTVWKLITCNLNASNEEYFIECINKINRDEQQIENCVMIIPPLQQLLTTQNARLAFFLTISLVL